MARPPYTDSTLFHASWPAGVIARYLTVGGATVDLTHITDDPERTAACCTGCDEADSFEWNPSEWDHSARLYKRKGPNPDRANAEARVWAQAHAETCRAMPKPGGA